MPTSGKRPKPTHLKLVKGAPPRDINQFEAKPKIRKPRIPAHLNAEAQEEWHRVCDDLYECGLLASIDRAILSCYCQAWGRWVEAETKLAVMAAKETELVGERESTHGLLIKTISGNIIQNPILGAANKAMADMVKYAV